ncbi:Gfo/Idh/MocA family oxidoreductase [Micromonospora sp. KC213]|uniref:Gfo/Idh/MocA family protein n=1 Tax=Micromonospora sp. KC213 TaxID=2530378 RepID=UPI001053A5C5|nr:Gfo/Idh/MocA family oxidoreductase [Micromonospora sp. KC213]TDC39582.1 Gfo/Idh/MocA family oxidoreductase [Micromonospora sp. KC213]
MPRHRYRTAIVGTGGIAHAHAQALRAYDERAELVAVVDVDPDRAREFAARWAVPKVYTDLAELLADARLDVIHVCTPPVSHAPLALQCLRAGVTVLVEKPPALSLAELDTLAAACRASGAHFATVFQHRFGSGAVRLREMAAAGRLGRCLLAICHTLWFRDDAYFEVPWRGRWETEGGGPTMGHGIHQFDLLLSVLGPWESVTAVAARRARRVDTEDVSMALVTFADGTVASVVNSVLSPRQTSALRFDFEYATVEVEHLYGYTDDDWTITSAPGHEGVRTEWAATRSDTVSGHPGQLAAVYDALDAGAAPPVGLVDTRRTMEFAAALYASAFTGEPIRSGQIDADHPFATCMNGTGTPW